MRSKVRLILNINLFSIYYKDMLIIVRECLLCFHFLFRPEKSKCTFPEERLSMGRAFHSILLESCTFLWNFGFWLFLSTQPFIVYENVGCAPSHVHSLVPSPCCSYVGISYMVFLLVLQCGGSKPRPPACWAGATPLSPTHHPSCVAISISFLNIHCSPDYAIFYE